MRFGFGVITCQQHPADPRTPQQVYADGVALAVEAERLGFDSVWLSEHHFVDDGYLPSVLVMAAAVAAATERVEIGSAVLLAPFHDPLRLAEDAAVADLLSGGRLVLGLGQGWRAEEFEAFGVDPAEGAKRLREAVRVMREAWSGGLVADRGVAVRPRPAAPSGPPIWFGGFKEKAVRRAARVADGFIGPRAVPEVFAAQAGWIADELERQGRPAGEFRLSLLAPVFAWEAEPAWEAIREHQHYVTWKYDQMGGDRGRTAPPAPPPPAAAADEERLRSMVVAGSPEEVVEALRGYEAAAGREVELIARLYWPGMAPEVQREAMRLFAERVIPPLRG